VHPFYVMLMHWEFAPVDWRLRGVLEEKVWRLGEEMGRWVLVAV